MINAVLMSPFRPEHLPMFADISGFHFRYLPEPTQEELSDCEVLLGSPSAELLASAKSIRWVQSTNAGVDTLTKGSALYPNLTLTNASGVFGQSISEYILAMILMLYKQLNLYRDQQCRHVWRDLGRQQTLSGKRVLILGAGDIGCTTARLLRPFGCSLIGMRRTPREVPPEFDRMITLDGLDSELPHADIIICALPSTDETRLLFCEERLSLLKTGAVLVNVGRGSLIDLDALTHRLSSGLLYGAALDVTDPEPLPSEHPLWDCPNVILTPHITGGSFGHLQETTERLFSLCRENLIRYRSGTPLLNRVDFQTGYRIYSTSVQEPLPACHLNTDMI